MNEVRKSKRKRKSLLPTTEDVATIAGSGSEDEGDKEWRRSQQKKKIARMQSNVVDGLVAGYSEKEFQENFHLTRYTFKKLISLVQPNMEKKLNGPGQLNIDHQLLATIWLLATPESFRSVSERFDMSKSTLSRTLSRIVEAINSLSTSVIVWPNREKRQENKIKFQSSDGFHNVIGIIDGTYVPIKAPKERITAYTNNKNFCSITLQAVCDADMKFTDCSVGYPGSVHDARVFKNSRIFRLISANKDQYCPNNDAILGDTAFPINAWCITPFQDNGNLNEKQREFNQKHTSTLQVIQRTFALLYGRWRRLHFLQMNNVDKIPNTILACCVLHNICLMFNDDMVEHYIRDGTNVAEQSQTNTNEAGPEQILRGILLRNRMADDVWRS